MNQQVLTSEQLLPTVKSLCDAKRYIDAIKVVNAFVDKGFISFDAAILCIDGAQVSRDGAAIKALVEPIQRKAAKDWRTWQLSYKAAQAVANWQEALVALDKVAHFSLALSGEYYLARAEVLEHLLRPEECLEALCEAESFPGNTLASRIWHVRVSVWSQQKRFSTIVGQAPEWLQRAPADRNTASVWKALGRAYDREGSYALAYASVKKGNQAQAALEAGLIGENNTRRKIEAYKTLFSKEWVRSWTPTPQAERTPVFLIGFPRSGTTLLEQVLDAHPDIQALEEPDTINTALAKALTYMKARASIDGVKVPVGRWKEQWLAVLNYMATLGPEQVSALRDVYFAAANADVALQDSTCIVDKMPLNTIDIGFILRIFPEARFIVALRHPADCVLSGYMQTFNMNDGMANFLDLDNGASFYKHTMRLLKQYQDVFQLGDEQMHFVRYEDVVADLEGQARAVLNFLSLPWNDTVMRYYDHAKQRGTLATPSYHGVTQKPYAASIDRWQRYGEQMAPALHHFEEAAERFGYSLAFKGQEKGSD